MLGGRCGIVQRRARGRLRRDAMDVRRAGPRQACSWLVHRFVHDQAGVIQVERGGRRLVHMVGMAMGLVVNSLALAVLSLSVFIPKKEKSR